MTYQKPPEISEEEWTQTPPSVRALLAQVIEQTRPASDEPAAVESFAADEGGTVRMPLPEPDDGEGATTQMPLSEFEAEEGSTINMPLVDTSSDESAATYLSMPVAEDEGGTMRMPAAASFDGADEGSTVAMPLDADLEEGTIRMSPAPVTPAAEDGATMMMAADAPAALDEGGTVAMPRDTAPMDEDEGATFAMSGAAVGVEADEGGTVAMGVGAAADEGGTVAMRDTHATGVSPTDVTLVASEAGKTQPQIRATQPDDDFAQKNIILQGRYQLKKILGKGGFGAAYLAEDINLERECVVKQMLSSAGVSRRELAQNQENFEQEAKLLADLNSPGHPNIPEIFDYFSDDSGSYLVMKYIEGQSLDDMLKASEQSKIPWKEAVRYTVDVCSALNYMHTHGDEPVMHRDIKPANILLGDDGRTWLVDFGLARTKPIASSDDLASTDASGSVGYTPFEQWIGEAVPASDIYATGITLHHMVTGQSPLEAYRETGKLQVNIQKMQDLHGQVESIRKIDRKLPKELDEIIKGAVVAEPGQRLTALQLQQQLEVLVSGAKNAVLFTFKNGESAKTIPQLVDLCEQNRVEAQGYLYRGDFERWFTLINRNDLADAAAKAVKQEGKDKDGLERFLKLIMPNIFWRRLGRASWKVARVGVQLLVILLLALLIVVLVGTLAGRWLFQQGIANRDWDYYALELDEENVFTEEYLTENAEDMTGAFLEFVQVDTLSPNQVILNANVGGFLWLRTPVNVNLEAGRPHISLSEVNGIPLYWIGSNLSAGVNSGVDQALAKAPVKITAMDVKDDAVIFSIEESDTVVYAPPTPELSATATPTPTPLPTPTPPGLALLAVFNDLPRPVILEVDGQRWAIDANDTTVIEKPPGTYAYTLLYAENGQLAAQGSKSWDHRAYRWRITEHGDVLE